MGVIQPNIGILNDALLVDNQPARDRQRQILKEIWGHLPPALREKMLNVYSEKYLPRYEDVVRDYFEALAEQGRSPTDR